MTTPNSKNPSVGVVLLAAGGGSRFGGSHHKLLTSVAGKTVFEWALQSALAANIGPVAVVWGSVELPRYEGSEAVTYLRNEAWATGMASSVQCALQWASERGLQSVVIGLGDQPCIPPSAWAAVANSSSPLAVATYQGVRANPVKLHAEFLHSFHNQETKVRDHCSAVTPNSLLKYPVLARESMSTMLKTSSV